MARTRISVPYSHDNEMVPIATPETASGQKIAIGSTSTQSAALSQGVYFVSNSVACYVAIGTNPTASDGATSLPLLGPSQTLWHVKAGEKIAVIRSTTDGSLWLTPVRTS